MSGRNANEAFVGDFHFVITPSDTVNFVDPDNADKQIDAIVMVMSAGTVVIVDTRGRALPYTFTTVPAIVPLRARRVNAAGTTGGMTLYGIS